MTLSDQGSWMPLTGKQAHVLHHLERVERLPFKLKTPDQRPRYRLDGWDCTAQITALVVKKLAAHGAAGRPLRIVDAMRNVGTPSMCDI